MIKRMEWSMGVAQPSTQHHTLSATPLQHIKLETPMRSTRVNKLGPNKTLYTCKKPFSQQILPHLEVRFMISIKQWGANSMVEVRPVNIRVHVQGRFIKLI